MCEIIGERVRLEPDCIVAEAMAGKACPVDRTIYVEDNHLRRKTVVHLVDPSAAEVDQRSKDLYCGQKLRLESPHLAGGCRPPFDGVAADDPTHGMIATKTVSVVNVIVPTKATENGLSEQSCHAMPPVLAGANVGEHIANHLGQSKGVIKFPVGEQTGVSGDLGTVKLQLRAAVEIAPKKSRIRLTHQMRHDHLAQCASSI